MGTREAGGKGRRIDWVSHLGVGPGVEREEGVLDGADDLLRRRRPQPRRHAEEEGHLAVSSPRRFSLSTRRPADGSNGA